MIRLSLFALSSALLLVQVSAAQSGSGNSLRPQTPPGSATAPASSGRAIYRADTMQAPLVRAVALEGFCAVCLLDDRDWVVGSTEYQAVFDGKTYRFPKAEALAAFQANPAKYVPALGGEDVVTYIRTGQRVPGKLIYGARHLDRHYFFASEANKAAFTADPVAYANADLAWGGACPVCRVDMNARIGGSPDVTATYNGLRYQFTGAQQRQAFTADPTRYAVPTPARNGSGSTQRPAIGSGSGSR